MTTPKILVYLLIARAPSPRALARRAPLLGRRAPVFGRRDRAALAGIGGRGIEATRAGAWILSFLQRLECWRDATLYEEA